MCTNTRKFELKSKTNHYTNIKGLETSPEQNHGSNYNKEIRL